LNVKKNMEISLENHIIKLEDLESKLKTISEYRKDKEVLLRADKDLPYGFVMKVIAAAKRAGIDKLGMITEPED
jgi:biopolymer transport protein TolR